MTSPLWYGFKSFPARHRQSLPVFGLLSTSRLICVFGKLCLSQSHIQTRNLPQLVGKFLLMSTRFLRLIHLLENRRAACTSSYFLRFYTRGFHDVQNVSGFVILHCCFSMPECVEGDLSESLKAMCLRCSFFAWRQNYH